MFDAEALIGPGMTDDGRWYPGVDYPVHSIPRHVMPLTTPPERAEPHLDHVIPERRDTARVCRHGVVGEVARDDAFQPFPLFGDALVQAVPHLLLDLREFGSHAFAHGLPLEQELAAVALRTDVRKAQEVKRFPCAPLRVHPVRLRVSAERDQAGFLRMQLQREHRQPFPQIVKETAGIRLVLEAGDRVIRVADHDHVPLGMAFPPLFYPEVIDVMQVDVRQQR